MDAIPFEICVLFWVCQQLVGEHWCGWWGKAVMEKRSTAANEVLNRVRDSLGTSLPLDPKSLEQLKRKALGKAKEIQQQVHLALCNFEFWDASWWKQQEGVGEQCSLRMEAQGLCPGWGCVGCALGAEDLLWRKGCIWLRIFQKGMRRYRRKELAGKGLVWLFLACGGW